MKFKTIAIIGLGLMGASLAAKVRRKFPRARVIGISRSHQSLKLALRRKWIHEASSDLPQGVRRADLIILATPVDIFPKILKALERSAKPGAIVTDVGSVKGGLGRLAGRLRKIRFVGAHPMVGSHRRGIGAADTRLYDHGLTFITKSGADPGAYRAVKAFWKKISPRVVEISPQAHDRIVAEISHLPHAVAVCLMLAASPQSVRFASSGFADTTRVAAGHPSVWLPIFTANARAITKTLSDFEKNFRRFKNALRRGSHGTLSKMLGKAHQKRAEISL